VARIVSDVLPACESCPRALSVKLCVALLLLGMDGLTPRVCDAYDILLRWTVPSSDVNGYRVYAGTASRVYETPRDVRKLSNATLNGVVHYVYGGLETGVSYYFAVTAYNASPMESDYSNEKVVALNAATPPRADAGLDQFAQVHDFLTLGSHADPGINYFWTQNSGPPATVSAQTSSRTGFRGDVAGTYTLTLIAYDAQGLAAEDSVTVVLTGSARPSTPTVSAPPTPTTPAALVPPPTPTPSASRAPARTRVGRPDAVRQHRPLRCPPTRSSGARTGSACATRSSTQPLQ
jgi:hypothetical protein